MTTKNINGYLIVNWKDETHRSRKSRPNASELAANEVVVKLDLSVDVPEVETETLAAEIEVPPAKVHTATLDALGPDDLPAWTETAAEVYDDVLPPDHTPSDKEREMIVGLTIARAESVPSEETVDEFVGQLAEENHV